MPKPAVIDNDFLSHLGDLNNHSNAFDIILKFFTELDYKVFMHPFVYKYEMHPDLNNPLVMKLFEEGVITVPDLSEVLNGKSGGKTYYELIVKKIYKEFTGKAFPSIKVCDEWKSRVSLGEAHSAAMCVFMDCNYLLSDDNDAVRYLGKVTKRATQKFIHVYNRQDCCDFLRKSGKMSRKELKLIGHKAK